nr:hypothetical protein [Verrucomicrobiota bacterium]
AISEFAPQAQTYSIKSALGESVGASALWQVICAAEALKTRRLPGTKDFHAERAIVCACGLNQQAAGLALAL